MYEGKLSQSSEDIAPHYLWRQVRGSLIRARC